MSFGSVQNEIFADYNKFIMPNVGDSATVICWTDRKAATVIEVDYDKETFVVQEDEAIRTDANGMSESQAYIFYRNPQGVKRTYKRVARGKNKGQWRLNGEKDGEGVMLGRRRHYFDYSF